MLVLTAGSVLAGCGEKKDMSMKMNEPRNIRGVVSYRRSFGDLNDVQLKSAKAIGIRPIASREEARNLGDRLDEIGPCELYGMDSLIALYSVSGAEASELLDTIGANFLDSLACKGLNPNRVIVTSVTRTRRM